MLKRSYAPLIPYRDNAITRQIASAEAVPGDVKDKSDKTIDLTVHLVVSARRQFDGLYFLSRTKLQRGDCLRMDAGLAAIAQYDVNMRAVRPRRYPSWRDLPLLSTYRPYSINERIWLSSATH
jgi:hypothetical protein